MIYFRFPNAEQWLNCLYFCVSFQIFFYKLCREEPSGRRIGGMAGDVAAYLLLFGITRRPAYWFVLLLHLLLALYCALRLWEQFRLQKRYALFLGVSFVLCRGTWNAQLLFTIFPLMRMWPAGLTDGLNAVVGWVFLYGMQCWVVRIEPERTVAWQELFSGLFPACATFAARIGIYHYCYYLKDVMAEEAQMVFALLGAFLALSTLVSLAASELYFSYVHSQRELDRAELQLKLQYQSFQEQQKKDEQMKGIYHDMVNHLSVLRGLAGEEPVQGYLRELQDETELMLGEVDTGNVTLNLLLRQKAEKCRMAGLNLEAAVSFPQGDFLTQMEICTLFANCIDNAIEALEAAPVEDRTIRVSGSLRHGCQVVRFENAYAHPLNYRDGDLVTGKGKGLHGYGLKNVRRVLEKHDGTLSVQPGDGRFVVTWMLPVEMRG